MTWWLPRTWESPSSSSASFAFASTVASASDCSSSRQASSAQAKVNLRRPATARSRCPAFSLSPRPSAEALGDVSSSCAKSSPRTSEASSEASSAASAANGPDAELPSGGLRRSSNLRPTGDPAEAPLSGSRGGDLPAASTTRPTASAGEAGGVPRRFSGDWRKGVSSGESESGESGDSETSCVACVDGEERRTASLPFWGEVCQDLVPREGVKAAAGDAWDSAATLHAASGDRTASDERVATGERIATGTRLASAFGDRGGALTGISSPTSSCRVAVTCSSARLSK
mmetsp:Transcript_66861/g.142944  ORF Transcript_66861/g.142944 Transcript_66861/m.142944 type:complete len:287 (+) Transcript_66861:386-1246(+)